ncbi:hypothetical protein P7C71_g4261, partial [Lecanoromycetidae sp. Uapishka_2]
MPFGLSSQTKSNSSKPQTSSPQPDTRKVFKYQALQVYLHGEIDYDIIRGTHRALYHTQDQVHYPVPTLAEPTRPENIGVSFRMLVWELKDDMVFTGESRMWRGRYSVWYRSDIKGSCIVVKQRVEEPVPGATVEYVDIPELTGKLFWFRRELDDIRSAVLAQR